MTHAADITPRPYRMHNQIQHYAWGTRDEDAYIAKLLGIEPEPGTPYAELWMGAHSKAPSSIEMPDGSHRPLDAWISEYPEAILGEVVAKRFGQLPFLFKVLSAGEALSIQVHPTKAQAETLHARDPEHYPDDNHKPEIAVALDELTALVGFKPFSKLTETLTRYPEIVTFVGKAAAASFLDIPAESTDEAPDVERQATYDLFAALIVHALEDPESLAEAVDALARRLEAVTKDLDDAEQRFLTLRHRYGSHDVGLFALFLFNLIHLKPGEAIYTDAGVPHAYLGGNIVECMANSDNVVRVGLTPKYNDAETLLAMVDTTPQPPQIMKGEVSIEREDLSSAVYPTPAAEFVVRWWTLAPGAEQTVDTHGRPAILLVTRGEVNIAWDEQRDTFKQGESIFIPANLPAYTLHATGEAHLVGAAVPAL